MKTFFPNFEEVYGHTDTLKIIVQSAGVPQIKISESQPIITATAVI
jgi:hypothetical protein